MSLIWVNGVLVDKAEARVSPVDHGFLYGDGVWEHLRAFGGRLFRPADHLKRLYSQASLYELVIPLGMDDLIAAVEATVQANNRIDGYVRVIVTRGPGNLGPDPRKIEPQVYIIAEEYQPFPVELYGHGLHAVLNPYPAATNENPAFWMRSLGRPDIALAKRFALRCGCLEAVLLNSAGEVDRATEGELFFVSAGKLHPIPPASAATSTIVLELAGPLLPFARGYVRSRPEDLYAADEVFLAGTACGVIGIVRLDGRDIGTGTEGPVTRAVREAYRKLTRGDAPAADTMTAEGGAT